MGEREAFGFRAGSGPAVVFGLLSRGEATTGQIRAAGVVDVGAVVQTLRRRGVLVRMRRLTRVAAVYSLRAAGIFDRRRVRVSRTLR